MVLGSLVQPSQHASQKPRQSRLEVLLQRHEVHFVEVEQEGADGHGSQAKQGEETGRVDEKLLGEPLLPDALEEYVVRLQGLEVDAAGQRRVHALGQALADEQATGNHFVLRVGQDNLRQTHFQYEKNGFHDQ